MTKILPAVLVGSLLLTVANSIYSQNIGIGITNPIGKLHIKGSGTFAQLVIDASSTQGKMPMLRLRNSGGEDRLHINSDSSVNAFFGFFAGHNNTAISSSQGIYNTAIGGEASEFNVVGFNNTAVGYRSLWANTASYNTALGAWSLGINSSGEHNTSVGVYSLRNNSTGNYNSGLGSFALQSNLSGGHNTAFGYLALQSNIAGTHNTATGSGALGNNVGGWDNTAVGYESLKNSNSQEDNTAMGAYSQYSNSTGNRNTATGTYAMYLNSSGSGNTALGRGALYNNLTGSLNIAIGYASGTNTFNQYENTISIGNIGYLNGFHNQAFLGNLNMTWNGGNVGWSTFSDARIKTNIEEGVRGLDFIMRLRPVTYHRSVQAAMTLTRNTQQIHEYPEKYDIEKMTFSGFLAQEVEAAAKEIGYDFNGVQKPRTDAQLYTLTYESFVAPMVKAIQEQQRMIEDLKSELQIVKKQNAALLEGKTTSAK